MRKGKLRLSRSILRRSFSLRVVRRNEDNKLMQIGLVISRRNYLEVYPYDKWSGTSLPDFQEGERFMPSICELKDGSTSRPNLLTEADLVGLMDKNGIGMSIFNQFH